MSTLGVAQGSLACSTRPGLLHAGHVHRNRNHAQSRDAEVPAGTAGDALRHARFRLARGRRGLAAGAGAVRHRRSDRRVLRQRFRLGHRRARRRLVGAQAASRRRCCSTISSARRRCSPAATRAASPCRPTTKTFDDDPADAEIVEQIKELIETRVRPAVAGDGGDILYRGFRDGVVYLTMQGACSGCPSSTATLKQGIEGLLKHYVPEVTEVRAA